MFGKKFVAPLVLAFSGVAAAADLSLEPCVNGAVSRTGTFPTQAMESQINAYLNWRSYDPYYLFAVSANYLQPPFAEDPDKAELD